MQRYFLELIWGIKYRQMPKIKHDSRVFIYYHFLIIYLFELTRKGRERTQNQVQTMIRALITMSIPCRGGLGGGDLANKPKRWNSNDLWYLLSIIQYVKIIYSYILYVFANVKALMKPICVYLRCGGLQWIST